MNSYLPCNQEFEAENVVSQQLYHKQFHPVDKNNYFCKNLFKKERNIFIPNKCVRCDFFSFNSLDKKFLEIFKTL